MKLICTHCGQEKIVNNKKRSYKFADPYFCKGCLICLKLNSCFVRNEPTPVLGYVDNFLFYNKDYQILPKKTKVKIKCACCENFILTTTENEIRKKHKLNCKSCSIKKEWETFEYKKFHKEKLKEGHNKPESKIKHSIASKRNFENPEFVKRHREYANKFIRKEHNGIKYRSFWELFIAKSLDQVQIKFEYEEHVFTLEQFENRKYIPDFYLPDYDLFLEIKGRQFQDGMKKFNIFINLITSNCLLIDQKIYREMQNIENFKRIINENKKNN